MVSFGDLPEEVLRHIIKYMDIPSLATISMIQKPNNNNISALAVDDTTWYTLIQNRFGIGCNHRRISRSNKQTQGVVLRSMKLSSSSSSLTSFTNRPKRRPKSYGGHTWKEAYRCLATTMRMPETSLSSGSNMAVFASPSLHGRKSNLGVWCMINHRENCKTKTVEQVGTRRRRNHQPNSLPYRSDRRYIELKLLLQNTKSGFGSIIIPNISTTRIASVHEDEDGIPFEDSTFKVIGAGQWRPKTILRRRFADDDMAQQRALDDAEEWNATYENQKDIILRPFEVVVLSLHVSCPETFVYETDCLSCMSSIRVLMATDGKKDVSIARFINEEELWEYYSQLPGGCLSLKDRSRLVPM